MRMLMLSSAVLIVLVSSASALAQAENAEGYKALRHFVGNWRTTAEDKPSKWMPEGAKHTDLEVTDLILKDKFLLGRQHREADGQKVLWIMTFDPKSNTYPFWFFSSYGVLGGEWSGTWDEKNASLTSRATDLPAGWTSHGVNLIPDKDSIHVAVWIKDEAGALLFDGSARKARQPDGASEKMLAEWSKNAKQEATQSQELKVLNRMVGKWEADLVYKPAEWVPQEKRTTRSYEARWILDGTFIHAVAKDSDGTASHFLTTYDPREKVYKQWRFTSEGQTGKWTGVWDAAAEKLTMKAKLNNDLDFLAVMHMTENDGHDWTGTVTDKAGKLYFHMDGKTTSRTKE